MAMNWLNGLYANQPQQQQTPASLMVLPPPARGQASPSATVAQTPPPQLEAGYGEQRTPSVF
jgi:hypothetical protein